MRKNCASASESLLSIACPWFPPAERAWLGEELQLILNGKLSMGTRVARFEQEFTAFCGCSDGVAFPSCTSALEASLIALGVQPGDEVLVPVETFVATGMAVHLAGAVPVFTEISASSFGMDFNDAWDRVTNRTRGAIVVHFGGHIPSGLTQFVERMRSSGRFVVEDAAHAPGAEFEGRRSGSIGDVGCFSFYPTKIMTTGEGGMAVTSQRGVASILRSLQNRGLDLQASTEIYARPGRNSRFSEIAAAMGLSQLRCLPEFLGVRRAVAKIYDEAFSGRSAFLTPLLAELGSLPSYWRYVILLDEKLDRRILKEKLAVDGIATDWAYDPPLHLQPVFRRLYNTREGMLPRSEKLLGRHLCLPVHARLQSSDAENVAHRLLLHVRSLAG